MQVQQQTAKKTSGGAKVTVACKIPEGIVIRTFVMVERQERALTGTVTVREATRDRVPQIVINGNAYKVNEAPRCRIVSGYALTEGVDAEIWAAWYETMKEEPMITNGLIFAEDTTERAVAKAKEGKKLLSGLEPLTPDTDPRTRVFGLNSEEEQAKRRRRQEELEDVGG